MGTPIGNCREKTNLIYIYRDNWNNIEQTIAKCKGKSLANDLSWQISPFEFPQKCYR